MKALLTFLAFFSLVDEAFQSLHSFFSFTNGDLKVEFKSLAFAWNIEDELGKLSHELCITNYSCAPSVHAEVALRVEVAIVDVNDLGRVKVLAGSAGCDEALLQRALKPNPAGNANQRTPLVLVRPGTASA